jgi:hypothetical protein
MSCQSERPTRFELVLQPWQGCVLTANTTVAWSHRPGRTGAFCLPCRRSCPLSYGGAEPLAGFEPAPFSVQASCAYPVAPRRRGRHATRRGNRTDRSSDRTVARPRALGGIRTLRTSRPQTPQACASASSATSAWSLRAASNRLLRITRATLCQVSYRGMAAGQGLEPRLAGSEPAVLPLDDPASVRKARFERASREF